MIRLHSDWSDIDRELDRLSRMPDTKTQVKLYSVLSFGFIETQAAVHVESGALKSSGKKAQKVDQAQNQWEGEIEYGGATSSVDYAIYEKRRGVHWVGPSAVKGDHDFFRPLEACDPLFVAAIKDGLGG